MTAATPATARPKVRPSALWIVVAIVLMVVGPGGCTVAMVATGFGIFDDIDEFGRFPLPVEEAPVTFVDDVDDGAIYLAAPEGARAPFVRVGLFDEDGEEVPLSEPDGDFTVDHPDATAQELFGFSAPAGTYFLAAIDEREVIGAQIWLGRSSVDSFAGFAIAAVVGGMVFLVGVIVLVIVLIRRRRSRAAQTPAAWPAPPAGWPPPPGAPTTPPPYPGQYPGPYAGVNPGMSPGLDPGLYPGLDPVLNPQPGWSPPPATPPAAPVPPQAPPPPPPVAEPAP
ncbi:MAG TPA: hypothetical protein VJM33_07880, partial [Microthrixaceae bacterium]|nr:hypothetical protein [Microthrixaceae bacterium]